MAAAENCIYKIVKLVAGETFILPPTAELMSVSDAGSITSSCGDELPEANTKCYSIRWVLNYDDEGLINYFPLPFNPPIIIPEANNAWDNESGEVIAIDDIKVGGTQIVTAGIAATDFVNLEATLAGSSAGALLQERKYNSFYAESVTGADSTNWNGDFQSGYTWYQLSFKATAEVAEATYLQFLGPSGNIGFKARYFPQEIDCGDFPETSEVGECE